MVAGASASLYASVVDFTTRMGFACIPLEPDSKRPLNGFDLSRYFSQRPSASELRSWFTINHPTNFAVMCGAVSDNLFVLDFDTSDAYADFLSQFPSLAQSFTVKTRRGYHVYLRSTHAHLRSRKLRGGELKAHGGYVVGAGSVIGDTYYTITVDAPILRLDDSTLNQLLTTLTVTSHRQPLAERLNQQSIALKLVHDYKSQALIIGRNNALYQAATRASYLGITQQTCVDTLASLHAHTSPIAQHPYETPAQRLQEARNTITSAYRYHHIETSKTVGTRNEIGVPNILRELLLKQRQILVLRLLDGFALAGWDEGKVFTLNDAIMLGKSLRIGRNSIIRIVNRNKAFLCSSPPVGEADNSILNSNTSETDTLWSKGINPPVQRRTRGRPTTRFYCVPGYKQLAKALGIALTGSTDKLSADDLRSNKAYRMALHRELVKRQTPELSNRFLAERLGMSERSLRRYNVSLGVVRTPIFGYEPLTWANVHDEGRWLEKKQNQAKRDVVGGRWLQLDGGKRYPAIRGIALKLLAKGKTAFYCRQLPNRLQLPDANALPLSVPHTLNHPSVPAMERGSGGEARTVIWRHLHATLPDYHGDAFTLPPLEPVSAPISVPKAKPDDLKVIKGIGKTTAGILRRAGIDSYVKLASVTNFDGIAKLFHNVYLTARQVAFWSYQADLLARGEVTADDLKSWRYRDWKDYQFELPRIKERTSDTFKWKLAEEFIDFGWLRYKPTLPDWFIELIAQVQRSRLL